MRLPKRVENFFFCQQILLAENVVKGPRQYKFDLAYRYQLSLVTKNIKVYKIGGWRSYLLFANLSEFIMCLFFILIFFGKSIIFNFCPKKLFHTKC